MKSAYRKGITRTVSIVIAVIIVVAASAGAFYAISVVPSGTTSQSSTQSVQNVIFGFAGTPDVTDTPGFMMWQTFAQQVGLHFTVQYFDGDPYVAQALVAGSLQVAEGGFQSVVQADETAGNSSGSYPFLVFASYEASNDFALVVSNSIKSWSDLAGQPIGVFSPGASSDILCHKLLEANGLSGTQINCVGQGDDPTRTQAMLAGKSVGTVIEPFDIITALVTGKYHILASVPQILPNLLFSVLYTSRAYASAHPDIIAKITEAALLADQWAHNETAWISKEQVEFPGTNTTVAGAAWKVWMAMNIWDPYGGLSASKLNYSMNYFVNISSISSTLAPNYWSDLSYQGTAIQTVGNFTGPLLGYPDNSIPKLNVSIPGVPSVIISNPGRLFGEGSSTGIFFAVPVESSWNSGRGF